MKWKTRISAKTLPPDSHVSVYNEQKVRKQVEAARLRLFRRPSRLVCPPQVNCAHVYKDQESAPLSPASRPLPLPVKAPGVTCIPSKSRSKIGPTTGLLSSEVALLLSLDYSLEYQSCREVNLAATVPQASSLLYAGLPCERKHMVGQQCKNSEAWGSNLSPIENKFLNVSEGFGETWDTSPVAVLVRYRAWVLDLLLKMVTNSCDLPDFRCHFNHEK